MRFFEKEDRRAELEKRVDEIGDYVWNNREKFFTAMPDILQAVEMSKAIAKPMIFVDFGDVPNAGSTGDGVAVLKAFLDAQLECESCVVVADERSVKQAVEVGVGNTDVFHRRIWNPRRV